MDTNTRASGYQVRFYPLSILRSYYTKLSRLLEVIGYTTLAFQSVSQMYLRIFMFAMISLLHISCIRLEAILAKWIPLFERLEMHQRYIVHFESERKWSKAGLTPTTTSHQVTLAQR